MASNSLACTLLATIDLGTAFVTGSGRALMFGLADIAIGPVAFCIRGVVAVSADLLPDRARRALLASVRERGGRHGIIPVSIAASFSLRDRSCRQAFDRASVPAYLSTSSGCR